MRVLMVTNMFPNDRNPTSGIQVKLQTESLRRQGIDIDIFFMNIGESGSKLNYIKGIWQVFWKTILNRYDVVHAHFGLSGLVARFQFRAPVIVSFTGGDVMHTYVGKLSRIVSRMVDASIVKSEGMKETLRNKNAYVIPNGVDFTLFKPISTNEARNQLGLSSNKKYILFVGDKGGKVKRFDLIKRVFSIVQERYTAAVELISIYRRPLSEISLYMNACDVLILTSDWEGSPNVIKEAMACNLPIVSVDVGDVKKVIGNTENCYICQRNPEDIATKLIKVLDENKRTNGREKILPLSSENTAKQIIALYHQVLDHKSILR